MKTVLNNHEYEVYSSNGGTTSLTLTLVNVKSIDTLIEDSKATKEVTIVNGEKVVQVYRGYTVLKSVERTLSNGNAIVVWETEIDDVKSLEIITGERPTVAEAEHFRADIEDIATFVDDKDAEDKAWAFPSWKTDTPYTVDERVQYESLLYKCIQAHTSQSDWTPDVTPALWKRVSVDEFPEWIQPTGAHDSYSIGDKVSHAGKHWESLVDGNVWEPSTSVPTLWKEVA